LIASGYARSMRLRYNGRRTGRCRGIASLERPAHDSFRLLIGIYECHATRTRDEEIRSHAAETLPALLNQLRLGHDLMVATGLVRTK
jgi:hypothetical protein